MKSNDKKNVIVKVDRGDIKQEVKVDVHIHQEGEKKDEKNSGNNFVTGCVAIGCGLGCLILLFAMFASGSAFAALLYLFL